MYTHDPQTCVFLSCSPCCPCTVAQVANVLSVVVVHMRAVKARLLQLGVLCHDTCLSSPVRPLFFLSCCCMCIIFACRLAKEKGQSPTVSMVSFRECVHACVCVCVCARTHVHVCACQPAFVGSSSVCWSSCMFVWCLAAVLKMESPAKMKASK